MEIIFEKEYLRELYETGKTSNKKPGNKRGLSSLRVNDQYRLEFREIPYKSDESIIEICSLVDITNHYK